MKILNLYFYRLFLLMIFYKERNVRTVNWKQQGKGESMKKRFGQMIKVKPEKLAEYKKWHANPMPGVNEMIKECGLKNYSIYSRGEYLFTYFEYEGEDFDADMAKMAADPATQRWWDVVKPLMSPLPDRAEGEFWSDMEEILSP